MNAGKTIGVVVSLAIFGAMGYMLMNENETTKTNGFEEKQIVSTSAASSTSSTSNTEMLSEEEQKVKDLKDENREFAVSDLYILKCSPCHGDSGQGIIGPKVSGKSEQEIVKKLYEYKEGKVQNSMMAGLLTNSTDDELKLLAKEISNFGK